MLWLQILWSTVYFPTWSALNLVHRNTQMDTGQLWVSMLFPKLQKLKKFVFHSITYAPYFEAVSFECRSDSLEHLCFSGMAFDTCTLEGIQRSFPNLRHLEICVSNYVYEGKDLVGECLRSLSHLRELRMAHCLNLERYTDLIAEQASRGLTGFRFSASWNALDSCLEMQKFDHNCGTVYGNTVIGTRANILTLEIRKLPMWLWRMRNCPSKTWLRPVLDSILDRTLWRHWYSEVTRWWKILLATFLTETCLSRTNLLHLWKLICYRKNLHWLCIKIGDIKNM